MLCRYSNATGVSMRKIILGFIVLLYVVSVQQFAFSQSVLPSSDLYQGTSEKSHDSIDHLQKQALKGDVRAQSQLGIDFTFGRGVPQNFYQAEKWYRIAAN